MTDCAHGPDASSQRGSFGAIFALRSQVRGWFFSCRRESHGRLRRIDHGRLPMRALRDMDLFTSSAGHIRARPRVFGVGAPRRRAEPLFLYPFERGAGQSRRPPVYRGDLIPVGDESAIALPDS